jgi:predicted O-methyltransferase YrrM
LWADRKEVVDRVAREFLTKPSNVLEVGTWMGKGSTQVWMELLPPGSSLTMLDMWKQYVATGEQVGATARMDSLHHVAINSTLRSVYDAESDGRLAISLIRADSKSFLPLLNDGSFDLIYLDGSHYYADVKADLQQAKRLIRGEGLICGDDFDLPPTPELIELAKKQIDRDFVLLDDGRAFHPGVMLAVTEELTSVQCESGFWWRRYSREGR